MGRKMGQNQETSKRGDGWIMTSLQKSQKMQKQTLCGHLDGFQNVAAKVGHHKRTETHWIKYRKRNRKKKKIFI
jgi:hypothetical protein